MPVSRIDTWEDGQSVAISLRFANKIMKNNSGKTKLDYYLVENINDKVRMGLSFKALALDENGNKVVVDYEPATYGSPRIVNIWEPEDIETISGLKETEEDNPREAAIRVLFAGLEALAVGIAKVSPDRKYINLELCMLCPIYDTPFKFTPTAKFVEQKEQPAQKTQANTGAKKEIETLFKMSSDTLTKENFDMIMTHKVAPEEFKKIMSELVAEGHIVVNGAGWRRK